MPKIEDDGDLKVRHSAQELIGVRIAKMERDSRDNWLVYGFDGSEGRIAMVAMIRADGFYDCDGNYFGD